MGAGGYHRGQDVAIAFQGDCVRFRREEEQERVGRCSVPCPLRRARLGEHRGAGAGGGRRPGEGRGQDVTITFRRDCVRWAGSPGAEAPPRPQDPPPPKSSPSRWPRPNVEPTCSAAAPAPAPVALPKPTPDGGKRPFYPIAIRERRDGEAVGHLDRLTSPTRLFASANRADSTPEQSTARASLLENQFASLSSSRR